MGCGIHYVDRTTTMSSDIPTLDRVDWHAESPVFPAEVPTLNAGTHIGMFAAWCALNGHWAENLREPMAESLALLQARKATGREFIAQYCDGKLVVELLTPEAGSFAGAYYGGRYMKDYRRVLAAHLPSEYHVEDAWSNYDLLAPVIDGAFEKWKNPPWWKLF